MDPRFDVELIGVTKRYGGTLAVDAISLRIPKASYCCLLGPSGCGKTSTLRMIAGHEAITEGDVLINGANVTGLPPVKRGTANDVPELRAVPASELHRQRGVQPAHARHRQGRAAGARANPSWRWCIWRGFADRAAGPASPAGSSSVWRWRAPWSASRAGAAAG